MTTLSAALLPGAETFDETENERDRFMRAMAQSLTILTTLWVGASVASGQDVAFLRGDCDGDGAFAGSVVDAVFSLNFNFSGGPIPPCMAAWDADADGVFLGNVTDAVYMLTFNFLGGPAPAAPYPECGVSESASDAALGCEIPGCTVDPLERPYLHYTFDELLREGTRQYTVDISGNGRDADAEPGGPLRRPVSAPNRFGRIERAFGFTTDLMLGTVLNLGHLEDVERNFSLCVWINRNGSGGSNNLIMTHANWWKLQVNGSSFIRPLFEITDPADPTQKIVVEDTREFGREEWHFLTVVVQHRQEADQSTIVLYRDGVPVAFNPSPIVGTLDAPGEPHETTIGGLYTNCTASCGEDPPRTVDCCSSLFSPFVGYMDDVRIYDRALSLAEVQQLFAEGGCFLGEDTKVVCP